MRRAAAARLLAIALAVGAPLSATMPPAAAQSTSGGGGNNPVRPGPGTSGNIPALGWYAMGGIACSAVMPIAGTIILGRAMTAAEVYRSTLTCFTGPVGLIVGPLLFPEIGRASCRERV